MEKMERDGLRQHLVEVGSNAEKLNQAPYRLSLGSSSRRAPIIMCGGSITIHWDKVNIDILEASKLRLLKFVRF